MLTTKTIKAAIAEALEAANIQPTSANVAEVYHCYMVTPAGHEVDLQDALEAAGFKI